jgi:hypothetical protein
MLHAVSANATMIRPASPLTATRKTMIQVSASALTAIGISR